MTEGFYPTIPQRAKKNIKYVRFNDTVKNYICKGLAAGVHHGREMSQTSKVSDSRLGSRNFLTFEGESKKTSNGINNDRPGKRVLF